MNVRNRLHKLTQAAKALHKRADLCLVTVVRVGSGMAGGLPPGVHFNGDSRVATVVFAGPKPDEQILADLQARMPNGGLTIRCVPDPVPQSEVAPN